MTFHELWRSGQPVYGFWFAYPNLLVIEQASRMGFELGLPGLGTWRGRAF